MKTLGKTRAQVEYANERAIEEELVKSRSRKWSKEEDEFVKKTLSRSIHSVAAELDRTYFAVQNRRKKIKREMKERNRDE